MSKEEPAWRAGLRDELDEKFISSGEEIFDLVLPHIVAAEERGREAGLAQFSAVNGAYNALALRTQSVREYAESRCTEEYADWASASWVLYLLDPDVDPQ